MKLYYAPGACSLSPHILLRELGIPFELERVDTKTGKTEKGNDYRAVNPKGAVPVLELPGGERLTEGPVISQYLADRKPESGLLPPAGSMARYRVQEWLNYITSELHKRFSPLYNPRAPEEWKAILREQIGAQFDYVSGALTGKTFLVGDQLSVADLYLFVILSWGRSVQIDLGRWPVLQEYWKRIAARPTVQAAWQAEGLKKK